jgi:hypothetical protein
MGKTYPGLHPDDMLSLSAMASYVPPPSFEEAYGNLEYNSPKESAEKAYADFTAYYEKHPTVFPSDDDEPLEL